MIEFEKMKLKNGLTVIVHPDDSTPMAAVNVMYDVGARDEDPEKTGFAHLFEHLMFGGSMHVPDFDSPVQQAGGENNAFTTNDVTNYYITLPAPNIETAFWLESDRMLELAFSQRSLDVQRNVVIEEFKQRYLNQPYGDVSSLIRELGYTVHPYRWPTIGRDISHIEKARLDDVRDFFYRHYAPNNAVLVVSGKVETESVFRLAEKWFGDLPVRTVPVRNLPVEPEQSAPREQRVERDVPFDGLYVSYHMDRKLGSDYHAADLISDILSNGNSSRMYRRLVMEQQLFSELDAYISGDTDPGLFTVAGKLMAGVDFDRALEAIRTELDEMKTTLVPDNELKKVINKLEANLVYSETSYLNKAMSLATYELLGDARMINQRFDRYREVTADKMRETARKIFREENSSTLYYSRKK